MEPVRVIVNMGQVKDADATQHFAMLKAAIESHLGAAYQASNAAPKEAAAAGGGGGAGSAGLAKGEVSVLEVARSISTMVQQVGAANLQLCDFNAAWRTIEHTRLYKRHSAMYKGYLAG